MQNHRPAGSLALALTSWLFAAGQVSAQFTDCDLDVLVIADTSGSLQAEVTAVCQNLATIESTLLQNNQVEAEIAMLAVADPVGGMTNSACLTSSVLQELGAELPNPSVCGPMLDSCATELEDYENWGAAVSIAADQYGWEPGRVRVIVVLTDEAACCGDPCNSADNFAISNAAITAAANQVRVVTLIATQGHPCLLQHAQELAFGTGGVAVTGIDAQAPTALMAALVDVCSMVPPSTCDPDLSADGQVNAADLALLLGAWGGPRADLTDDGTTNAADLALLLGAWGPCK